MISNDPDLSTRIGKAYGDTEEKARHLRRFRDQWSLAVLASDVTGAAVRVAWLLALDYLNTDPGNPRFGCAWPSKPTMAKRANVSFGSAKRAVRELEDEGFLLAVDQLPNNGFQNSGSIVYALRLPGATDEPGVMHDPGPQVSQPGATDEPHPGSPVNPNSLNNSLNYSNNFPVDAHFAPPAEDHLEWHDDSEKETLAGFLEDERTHFSELLPYWVQIAMKHDTELTFSTAFEACVDAAQEYAGEDALRRSWASAFMAMMKAIATGETGTDGEVADLAAAVQNADTARIERVDRLRRGERTWRWFKASMPDSPQRNDAQDAEWRFVWEQLIHEGYGVGDLEEWIGDNRDGLFGKYPKEVSEMVEFDPFTPYREQVSA